MLENAVGIDARLRAIALVLSVGVAAPALAAIHSSTAFAQPAEERPWLGVFLSPDSPDSANQHALGVRVGHVIRGSPAAKVGIRDGDRLVRVDATPVATGSDVIQAVAARAAGDSIRVGFLRA
ncbi:MAG: PDZ domain-containing protein, partial [Polyangiaceae bacterium]